MSFNNKKTPKHENVIGAWIGFVIVTSVFGILSVTVFRRWQWWMGLPVGFCLLAAIITTIVYIIDENIRVCPKCKTRLFNNSNFCRQCGAIVYSNCPSCRTRIRGSSQFCYRCGQNLK